MIVVVIIGGGSVTAIGVERYAPLEEGSTFQAPPESILTTEDVDGVERTVYRVGYRHGRETRLAFSVRNGGRWRISIVDLPILHATAFQLFRVKRATVSDPDHKDRGPMAFKPFLLRPGEERLITLYGVFSDCDQYVAGSGNAYDGVQVRSRFAWAARETWISIPARVHVISPPDSECPVRPPSVRTGPRNPTSVGESPTMSP